ncbi:MAG: acryloyl-CoA reductase [Frankiaceae bacterium]|jgi:acrylyl-CoA reductase (NADPH)|nr:acryloyl-CoA reductase [Frankiaceae bacterium]
MTASIPATFPALAVEHGESSSVREVRDWTADQLGDGDVLIAVSWSGVNYKDALAGSAAGKVARISPLIPGIDLAGRVVEPGGSGLGPGDEVVAHGYDLGVAHHGGYAAYARVPAGWVVPLPAGLSSRQAMTIGTAGFTAALSVDALETAGLVPGAGPVVVSGASGGVGSVAVGILAARGYEVVASTGKPGSRDRLLALGAAEVIGRDELGDPSRPMQRERWAGAVDCVGGQTLAAIISALRYGSAVAASGNAGGIELSTTVFPFILRGASLLGIDSAQCEIGRRRQVWERIAGDLRPRGLDDIAAAEVGLADVPAVMDSMLAGQADGRTLVAL